MHALDASKEETFDVASFDVHMPRLDRLTLLRRIRDLEAQNGGRRLPIVIVTASAFPDEVREYLGAGADEVLTTPFDVESLRRTLRRWAR